VADYQQNSFHNETGALLPLGSNRKDFSFYGCGILSYAQMP
jgi:hypothetical protein